MKASSLLVIIFVLSIVSANAQSYKVGTNVVSAGVGLGSSIAGYSYGSQSPAFSLQYERGLWKVGPGVISLGGYLGFKSYKYSDQDFTEKWNYTIIGVRGAYHYTGLDIEKLDLYGGLLLAYDNLSYSYSSTYPGNNYNYGSTGSYGSALGVTVFVGARYYFSDHLGVVAELGYGVAYLNLGLAVKF